MPPKTFKPPEAAPQKITQKKPAMPPSISRKKAVIVMHIGIAERTSLRGEYLSDRNPHNGFENAFIRELILQASADVDTDNPDSLRYGTN